MGENKLRVLLADDHTLFREGLAAMMSLRPGLAIVGQAENGLEAIEKTRELQPDLVLMDVHMPVCDGIEAVKAIKRDQPRVKIVMLSASDDDDDLFMAVKSGADGYLLKNLQAAQLLNWLEDIRRGVAPISGVLADRILREFRKGPVSSESDEPVEELTAREKELLALLVQGDSNKEIADALCISEHTVKIHLRNILDKLHLHNRIQVAVYAVRQGLVDDKSGY